MGYLLKTPSSKGPANVLSSLALGAPTAAARSEVLVNAIANAPSNRRWWVLVGTQLSCYYSRDEWAAGEVPRLSIEVQDYTVLETRDHVSTLTIALLHKRCIRPAEIDSPHDTVDDASVEKSWYLTSYPIDEEQTLKWFGWLRRACALRRVDDPN